MKICDAARSAAFFLMTLCAGCGVSPFSSSFFSSEMRQTQALQQVDRAVDALNAGNRALSDRLLDAAAYEMQSMGSGPGELAQRLIERGHPEVAYKRLEPLVRTAEWRDDPLVHAMMARAARGLGDDARYRRPAAEARRLADEAMKGIGAPLPKDGMARERRAIQLLKVGLYWEELAEVPDSRAAIRALREALRLAPENPLMLNALGYTLAEWEAASPQDLDSAVSLTRKAVELAPGNAVILDSYGWALFRRGKGSDAAGARRVLREAVDLAPEIPEIRFHLGMAYWKQDQTRDAALELDRALALRPGYEAARNARQLLKVRWGV